MIPSLVSTPNGHLLAFTQAYLKDGRPPEADPMRRTVTPTGPLALGDGNDGWVDIVCKRSEVARPPSCPPSRPCPNLAAAPAHQ